MSTPQSSKPSTLHIVAGLAATGLFAYAVYFDYKRRNDAAFRKNLRKEKKRVDKNISSSRAAEEEAFKVSIESLRAALETVKQENVPVSPQDREAYFMTQVATGEQLSMQGPVFRLPAAMAFYKALRVYPSPVELISIYQKTVPEHIFKLVIEMTNLDVRLKVQGYYDVFPPKSYNVSVETRKVPFIKHVLVASRDFKAGETIYKENPVVAALDVDVQAASTHCTHCFRAVDSSNVVKSSDDPLSSVFCSNDCLQASQNQSHNLIFSLNMPVPSEVPVEPQTPQAREERRKAQALFVQHIKKERRTTPVLIARFVGRQVQTEFGKLTAATGKKQDPPSADYTDAENGEYALADHVERLRYIDVTPPEDEFKLLTDVLNSALPGLEQFVADDRHPILTGKIAYNAFGVYFGEGRSDKPVSDARPEDLERTRIPVGTFRQIGSALYLVSSYLGHSCAPVARPVFSEGTTELHLVADRDIAKGEEITVAYVDVSKHSGESEEDCRRRRRMELARGWKFACPCSKCSEETKETGTVASGKDESKLEASIKRFEDDPAHAESLSTQIYNEGIDP